MSNQLTKVRADLFSPENIARISATTNLEKGFVKQFITQSFNQIVKNPYLINCSPHSLQQCIIECATWGIVPDGIHAYMIPYGNKNTGVKDANLQISYKGLNIILHDRLNPEVSVAMPVYEKDLFKIDYSKGTVSHTPDLFAERSDDKIVGFYARIKLPGKQGHVEWMNRAEMDAHRDKYSKAAKSSVANFWQKNYMEMGVKTVFKRALKFMPLGAKFHHMLAMDSAADRGENQHIHFMDSSKPVQQEAIDVAHAEHVERGKEQQREQRAEQGKGAVNEAAAKTKYKAKGGNELPFKE